MSLDALPLRPMPTPPLRRDVSPVADPGPGIALSRRAPIFVAVGVRRVPVVAVVALGVRVLVVLRGCGMARGLVGGAA